MPDEIPPDQRVFYYRAYHNPESGEFYSIRGEDGLWRSEKIPAVLIDGLPSAGAGKGGRTVQPMRKLRSKR